MHVYEYALRNNTLSCSCVNAPLYCGTTVNMQSQRHRWQIFFGKLKSGEETNLNPAPLYPVIGRQLRMKETHTHTHTHPFNGPLSRTTQVSQYQKGKTNLDFTEARDSGISWAICNSAPRSRQITTPAPHRSVFYRPDALPAAQPTVSKHWRQMRMKGSTVKITDNSSINASITLPSLFSP